MIHSDDNQANHKPDSREEMLRDLEIIRQAVSRSQNVLRRIPMVSGMRPVMLLTGLILLIYCGGRVLLDTQYGAQAPGYLTVGLNALLAVGCVAAIYLKLSGMLRLARQDDASMDMSGLVRALYNRSFSLLAATAGFLAVGLPVWLSWIGQGRLILPVLGMVMGIMMMGIIAIFDMREMIVGAVWLIGCGYVLLWFMGSLNLWLALMLEFSVPMLLMWVFTKPAAPRGNPRPAGGKRTGGMS